MEEKQIYLEYSETSEDTANGAILHDAAELFFDQKASRIRKETGTTDQ